MTAIPVRSEALAALRGKTAIITGGANGIGKTTALLLHEYGANVVVGDVDVEAGETLIAEINRKGQGLFQRTDICDWKSLQGLFSAARERFRSIDIVYANAGIAERPPFLYDDMFSEDGTLAEPSFRLVDVNVNGVMRTAKLALHFFARNPVPGGSLVITGSAASYFAAAPIVQYGTAKHALLGLMRSTAAICNDNVRVNLVAPWMTETEFSSEARTIWGDMPINSSHEVAEALLVAGGDETLHGRTLYVAKEIVDFEKSLRELQPQWMTSKQKDWFEEGRIRLAAGMGLPTDPMNTEEQS